MRVPFLGWEDALEEGIATHSSILAWRIPRTEEPGGLQSMGCIKPDMTKETACTRDGLQCGASFSVFICSLCIFFGEVFVKVFGPF